MSGALEGALALITGAAQGIGLAIAECAAAAGAKLVLSDISPSVEQAAQSLRRTGFDVVFQCADVRHREQIDALVALCRRTYGASPTVAFANAGVEGQLHSAWQVTEAEFQRVIDTNVGGVWRTAAAVLPGMIEQGRGAIVATASVAGLVGSAGLAPYVASKHAVVGLVKALALETARLGIRVNAICPGVIDTAMVDRLEASEPRFRELLLAMKPMGRMGTSEEVARAAVWLASDAASFTTGHALTIDGGFVTQ